MYKLLNSKDIIFKICVVCAVGFVVAVLLGTLYVSKDIDSSGRVGNGRFEISADQINFGLIEVGDRASQLVTIRNSGDHKSGPLRVSTLFLDEGDAASFATDISGNFTLQPGESRNLNIYFDPTRVGNTPGMLFITHSGAETVSVLRMEGVGIDAFAGSGLGLAPPVFGRAEGEGSISFLKSQLNGLNTLSATSIQFGPDQRLYAAALDGAIYIYDIERIDINQYNVVQTEQIDVVKNIPNHDDDGQINLSVNTRLVTGIAVSGTASEPVIYVNSSDPRIGGGGSGLSTNLDTNSGVLSKLTLSENGWQKLDLVRGLPRSEENHHANGIALDESNGKLYIAMGGNTNQGAPSNNFAKLPEYALSAAILEVDLLAIGDSTYDLPTLDDEDRPGTNDANDPFGGNRGKNQAMLTTNGPVQVHAPGFRNPYDVLISSVGQMYSWDNGPNGGWGGHPGNVCSNSIIEPGDTRFDGLHLITGRGYYGGHPNPTRASTDITFNSSNPQSPVPFDNLIECEYFGPAGSGLEQHPQNFALMSTPASTNGLTEYTASNFQGAMQGDLLAAAFNNKVYRVKLNDTGTAVDFSNALFSNVGETPLDVTAQGDDDVFPGTIWVSDFFTQSIVVFEPQDYGQQNDATAEQVCSADNPLADPDNDGFTTEDETANGTDPCSPADYPQDSDNDGVSDLLDQDDDNDGLSDSTDPFALDELNGAGTIVPVNFHWENDSAPAGFIAELGFSGLMTNNSSDYTTLFDLDLMTVRGAAGVLTLDSVPEGDALATSNTQEYGFQFGVNISPGDPELAAHTRVVAPFAGVEATGSQSIGLFIGNGDQDNYIKLVVNNGSEGGIEVLTELNGEVAGLSNKDSAVAGSDYVDLFIKIDPSGMRATAFYQITSEGVAGAMQSIGDAIAVPDEWLSGTIKTAVGIISTSRNGVPFPATWDFIEVTNNTQLLANNFDKDTDPTNDSDFTQGAGIEPGNDSENTQTSIPATPSEDASGGGGIGLLFLMCLIAFVYFSHYACLSSLRRKLLSRRYQW